MNYSLTAVLLCILCAGAPAFAQIEDELPSTESVVSNFVEALGGEMAVNSRQSFEVKGRVNGPPDASFTFLFSDGKFVSLIDAPGPDRSSGFDGEFAWSRLGVSGYKRARKRADESTMEIYALPALALRFLDYDGEIEVTEMSRVGERNAWVLEFKSPGLVNSRRFFDVDTGLLIQSTMGAGDAETKYGFEYFNPGNDGLKFVSRITATVQGKPRFSIEIDSVDFDPDLTEKSFAMPEGLSDLRNPDDEDQ